MNNNIKKTVIIGGSGHSHAVCDLLLRDKTVDIIGIVDDVIDSGFYGLKLLGGTHRLKEIFENHLAEYTFVAIGSNPGRYKLATIAEQIGYKFINVISPHAVISQNAVIGSGNVIMPGAIVNADAHIGNNTVINTNCSIDHETIIHDFVHIAPGCSICGRVTIGMGSFVGTGARIINGVKIGKNVMIGAGAAVINDIPDNFTAVGVPAKIIKENNEKVNFK